MPRAPRVIERNGARIPTFLYGTAWKEDQTTRLVELALAAGFRGIDTANQRRHYFEAAVGDALASAFTGGRVRREDLFLQTKFTYRAGQDHRLPYDPDAAEREQVRQSFQSSLEHLHTDHLDSYVLHGPELRYGLSATDLEVWREMEALAAEGKTKLLGVSNVDAEQLAALLDHAKIAPTFVQNRCYARLGWDREVRAICRSNDILYQGFSLLTANREVLQHHEIARMAARAKATAAQVIFRFALDVGMVPLTGTSSEVHMREDLAAADLELDPGDVERIERISSRG